MHYSAAFDGAAGLPPADGATIHRDLGNGVLVLNIAMVGTLTLFAEPFTDHDGVYIAPRALDSVMVRMQGSYPGPAWEPCEDLAAS